jgi:hypothetical protein
LKFEKEIKKGSSMIIYEVITTLNRAEDVAAWVQWMRDQHVQHVVDTGCFSSAELLSDTEVPTRFTARYKAPDMESLQRYMLEYAPKLRTEYQQRFGGKVEVSRSIWQTEGLFKPAKAGEVSE